MKYKFISDGNWTADIKAPDTIDDGFGGLNGLVDVDALGGGGNVEKAKINFVTWTMMGVQSSFKTQGASDKSKKGMDLDSVTLGLKSYDKVTGQFLPGCPFYIEIALAERELEDYDGNKADALNYLYRKNDYGVETVTWQQGLLNLASGFANPVSYLAGTDDNQEADAGPGSNPYLGHLKFGFDTPFINFLTGFNYAKPDSRAKVLWTTVDKNWDAGYNHVGGFSQFSLGKKVVEFLTSKTGLSLDAGFAPNKTADRKGTKYGYWAWATVAKDELVVDFQSNGAYNGEYLFTTPVEHDFILGAKDKFNIGDGKLTVAAQALVSTHQADTDTIVAWNQADNPDSTTPNVADYFGYSTDVWYRTNTFDGIQNIAGAIKVGYSNDLFDVTVGYRMRGMQASMLYLRENHDDGTFDLSSTLGCLNTQAVSLDGSTTFLNGGLGLNLSVEAEMALQHIGASDEAYTTYAAQTPSWWVARGFDSYSSPLLGVSGGTELSVTPEFTVDFDELAYIPITMGVYGDLKFNAYQYDDNDEKGSANWYSYSNSPFAVKKVGLYANINTTNDFFKGANVYYGFDLSDATRWFNTLIGQVSLPMDIKATAAVGLKTKNALNGADYVDAENNPFAFAVGLSKQFQAAKKPIVYAQFLYNMDPFKHFGDGQDNLNLDRANVKGSWAKESATNDVRKAVNWYDGRAAVRVGIRWDF